MTNTKEKENEIEKEGTPKVIRKAVLIKNGIVDYILNGDNKSTKENEIEKDNRPVRCYVCKKKMYYAGHPKFEPEYQIVDDTHHFVGYIHKRCLK